MIELVTLDQIKARLRIDTDAEDGDLVGFMQSASRMVLSYLKLEDDAYLNSDGTMDVDSETSGYYEVPAEVQAATLYLAGVLYRDRDGGEVDKWAPGYLPAPVTAMLYPLRDPTLA